MTIIGAQIRDLKILSAIGEGGMGVVYLAEHIQLGKKFAVKCLTPELARNPRLQERFRKEARAQARLLHPNIVQVTDYFEENGNSYLLMEYVDGKSLDEIIESEGMLPEKICVPYLKDILKGLNFAHSQGVIHRDIKPSNIIIDRMDKARIMDFGIAIQAGERRLTKTGTDVGTAWYMSPEQVIRPREIDHRSDVYSVGVVLYEMLTGQVPFDGETDYTVKDKHVRETPIPVGMVNSDISMELAGIVMKALEKDPDDRFSGCGEFLEYIEACERERPSEGTSGFGTFHQNIAIEALKIDSGGQENKQVAASDLPDSVVPPPEPTFTDPVTGMAFLLVPGGRFLMGDVFGEGDPNEQPVREMEISAFYLGRTPVTQGQWEGVMGTNPSRFSKGAPYPVEMVSWEDAREFIQKLTAMNERKYQFRLPTEAEWEFAARSGGKNEKYAGGNTIESLAWYDENSADSTHPVGEKTPNGLGFCDMSGNVWEWCEDWFMPYPPIVPSQDPELQKGTERILRGGAWDSHAAKCRTTSRYGNWPKYRDDNWGFRLAMDITPPEPLNGNLLVVTTPKGASIWLDGIDTGQQTDALMDLPAGNYQVTLRLEDCEDADRELAVTKYDVSKIDIRMEKKQALGSDAAHENAESHAGPKKSKVGKIWIILIALLCAAVFYGGFLQLVDDENAKEASVVPEKSPDNQINPRQTEPEATKETTSAAPSASIPPSVAPPAQGCIWGNCRDGYGTWVFSDGSRYTGAFQGDAPHGDGTMTFADGGKYTGQFRSGIKEGEGTYTLSDGREYIGTFKEDRPHGKGILTAPNGDSYNGEWRAGSPNGKGTSIFSNGEKYTGELRDGKRGGKGTLTYPDGSIYAGDFRDGEPHGRGALTIPKVGKYKGEWKNGRPHGNGELFCSDGRKFIGEYKDVLARQKEPPKTIQAEKASALIERERKKPETREVMAQTRDYIYYADGILKDNKTGLEWYGGPNQDTTFHNAEAWVKSLHSFEGGDWRIPHLDELKSLNNSDSGPYEVFSYLRITGWKIWYMSEKLPGSSGGEWYFNFSYGLTGWGDSPHDSNARALAVRMARARR